MIRDIHTQNKQETNKQKTTTYIKKSKNKKKYISFGQTQNIASLLIVQNKHMPKFKKEKHRAIEFTQCVIDFSLYSFHVFTMFFFSTRFHVAVFNSISITTYYTTHNVSTE